jgi:peptide/nickel transport system substrate-binding protein
MPGTIDELDPLVAEGRAERLASRQIHEPLVSNQNGPFGATRERPGLVRSLVPSSGKTIWTATLRPRVRFQDGVPLDADAVRANVDRWLATSAGRELLPELIVADNPAPGVVRFQLARPTPDFPRRLADARLGIVAPAALDDAGSGTLGADPIQSGSGPFELREQDAGGTLLARHATWWGAPLGLGPGVDQIEFVASGGAGAGVELLASGSVEVAALTGDAIRSVMEDPLLSVVRGGGPPLGIERSVRGLESAEEAQPLADVWLTDLP